MATPDLTAWRAILERVRAVHPPLASILQHAMPLEIGSARVLLGYGSQATFLAEQAKEPEALETLTREVRAYFGAPTEVALDLSAKQAPGIQTVATLEAEKRKAQLEAARAEVERHPLVAEAIRLFGAEVRDIKLPGGDD